MYAVGMKIPLPATACGLVAAVLASTAIFAQPRREAFEVLKDPVAINRDSVGWTVGIVNGDVFSGGWGGTFSSEGSGIGLRFKLDNPTNPTRFGPDYVPEAEQFGRWLSAGDGLIAMSLDEVTTPGDYLGIGLHDAQTTILQTYVPGYDDRSSGFLRGASAIGSGYLATHARWEVRVYSTTTGELLHELWPRNAPPRNGSDEFGYSLSIEGTLLAVGDPQVYLSDPGIQPDRVQNVWLFELSSGQRIGSIPSPEPLVNDANVNYFAQAVVLSNGLLAVGAPGRAGYSDLTGRIYIYNAATLELMHVLVSPNPLPGDSFGHRLAADNGKLLVQGGGAVLIDPDCETCGYTNTYLYDMLTGEHLLTFVPPDAIFDDRGGTGWFGLSIAIEDNLVAIGAPRATNIPYRPDGTGAIAVYEIVPTRVVCDADTNNDGVLSPADYGAWILAYNNRAPECDQNNDELCTPADFNAWIINYSAGCE